MAAPTIRQIRSGLKTRLATISGLRCFDHIPGQFSPPAGIVGMPQRMQTETYQRGTDNYEVSVWIVVARQSDRSAEQNLESYLDPTGAKSVRAAVLGDKTLGGVVADVHELSAESVDFQFGRVSQDNDQQQTYIGLEFRYRILAAGA